MIPEYVDRKRHDYSFARDRQLQNKLLAADDIFDQPKQTTSSTSANALRPSNLKDSKFCEVTGWCPDDRIVLRRPEHDNSLSKPRTSIGTREYLLARDRSRKELLTDSSTSFSFHHYAETHRYIEQYRREHTCTDSTNSASTRTEFLELQRFYAYRAQTGSLFTHPTTVGYVPPTQTHTPTKREQSNNVHHKSSDSNLRSASRYKLSPSINVRSEPELSKESDQRDSPRLQVGANAPGSTSKMAIHAVSKTPIPKVPAKVTVPASPSMISPSLNKTLKANNTKTSSPKVSVAAWENAVGAVRTLDTLACVANSGDKDDPEDMPTILDCDAAYVVMRSEGHVSSQERPSSHSQQLLGAHHDRARFAAHHNQTSAKMKATPYSDAGTEKARTMGRQRRQPTVAERSTACKPHQPKVRRNARTDLCSGSAPTLGRRQDRRGRRGEVVLAPTRRCLDGHAHNKRKSHIVPGARERKRRDSVHNSQGSIDSSCGGVNRRQAFNGSSECINHSFEVLNNGQDDRKVERVTYSLEDLYKDGFNCDRDDIILDNAVSCLVEAAASRENVSNLSTQPRIRTESFCSAPDILQSATDGALTFNSSSSSSTWDASACTSCIHSTDTCSQIDDTDRSADGLSTEGVRNVLSAHKMSSFSGSQWRRPSRNEDVWQLGQCVTSSRPKSQPDKVLLSREQMDCPHNSSRATSCQLCSRDWTPEEAVSAARQTHHGADQLAGHRDQRADRSDMDDHEFHTPYRLSYSHETSSVHTSAAGRSDQRSTRPGQKVGRPDQSADRQNQKTDRPDQRGNRQNRKVHSATVRERQAVTEQCQRVGTAPSRSAYWASATPSQAPTRDNHSYTSTSKNQHMTLKPQRGHKLVLYQEAVGDMAVVGTRSSTCFSSQHAGHAPLSPRPSHKASRQAPLTSKTALARHTRVCQLLRQAGVNVDLHHIKVMLQPNFAPPLVPASPASSHFRRFGYSREKEGRAENRVMSASGYRVGRGQRRGLGMSDKQKELEVDGKSCVLSPRTCKDFER